MTRRLNGWTCAAILVVAAIGGSLITSACSDSGGAEPLPDNPHIRGVINDVAAGSGDALGTALIEGIVHEDTTYDAASVRIDGDTEIYRQSWEELIPAEFSDLSEGQAVEAWFTGPVAESYPVQATAAKIVIMADAPTG